MTKYQNKLSTLKDTNLVFNKLETNAYEYVLAIAENSTFTIKMQNGQQSDFIITQ